MAGTTPTNNPNLTDRIINDFRFHPATAETGPKHQAVREAAELCAHKFTSLVPQGRELSTALTKLEEAMFWANAAVARSN